MANTTLTECNACGHETDCIEGLCQDCNDCEIVKVQISLMSTEGQPQALIYNKAHSIYCTFPADGQLQEAVGEGMKKFLYAKPTEEQLLDLRGEAPWQDW